MARRHSDNSGQQGQFIRRDYLRVGGPAVGYSAGEGGQAIDENTTSRNNTLAGFCADSSTATGMGANNLDGSRFSGELVSFRVNGTVDVTLEEVN